MKKIYVFGNEFFEGDEVAKELTKLIKNPHFKFIYAESPNEILNVDGELIILDVVKGIKDVKLLENIDDLVLENSVTCHDLDLGFYLKLLKETGKITKVKIIGLPFDNFDYESLRIQTELILHNLQ